jgi:hypothetical protein
MPQASAKIPQGCGGCFEKAAFYPEKPWQARPSYARRNVVLKPSRKDTRGTIHHFA